MRSRATGPCCCRPAGGACTSGRSDHLAGAVSGSTGSRAPAWAPTRCRCCTSRYRRVPGRRRGTPRTVSSAASVPATARTTSAPSSSCRLPSPSPRSRSSPRMRGGGQRQAALVPAATPSTDHWRTAPSRPSASMCRARSARRCRTAACPSPRAAASASAARVYRGAAAADCGRAARVRRSDRPRPSTSGCVPVKQHPGRFALTAASPVEEAPARCRRQASAGPAATASAPARTAAPAVAA